MGGVDSGDGARLQFGGGPFERRSAAFEVADARCDPLERCEAIGKGVCGGAGGFNTGGDLRARPFER
ncbi:MAG: hypothetical protein DYG93_13630 [Leptolyngbya sp. PLA2]|nr:hypothetical protein [Leptolyngbya sp. PL-A2]